MTDAISINVGLNYVNADAYDGWEGALSGCVNDARAMQKIADDLGYVSTLILNENATADRIITEVGQAAWNLDQDGIVLLTFSGHGGQIPDVNGDETDGQDETWVTYDRQLIDDELYNLWNQFSSGARLVIFSDSCHSGTVSRNREYLSLAQSEPLARHYRSRSGPPRFRAIPDRLAHANYQQNKSSYDALQFASGSRTRGAMDATVLLISGCQDNQLSSDGDANGLFTEKLLNVWRNGGFSGGYRAFHQAILDQMPATQTPNYYMIGASNPGFEAQKPFTPTPPKGDSGTSGGPATDWPSITGPSAVMRTAQAPSFSVNAGPGRYFAVEFAASAPLFDITNHGGERNSANFYGSWSDTALQHGTGYTMPAAVWQQLRDNASLYYRIGSTTNPNGWDDYRVSSADADGASAPMMQISG